MSANGVYQPTSIAVIGSGVAGLVAAHVATRGGARVTLYDASTKAGGHADTTDVVEGNRVLAIDTGFIVHNRVTYPVLCRLFDELDIATQDSEMSMSIADDSSGLQWAGGRGLSGIIPTWRHLFSPRYLRMLVAIPRFHRAAKELLARPRGEHEITVADFLHARGFTDYFRRHYMEPLIAAVWSCPADVALDYPARYLFTFLEHHGMLSVSGSPTWRTVSGGSREYVERVTANLAEVKLGRRVAWIYEHEDGVDVIDSELEQARFDAVIIATHPHQALDALAMATPQQREVLSAIDYAPNRAVLHTDTRLLPRTKRTWSSWNFRRRPEAGAPVTVTYDLTRLQRLDTDVHYLVTLGAEDLIDPATVLAVKDYEHPLYTPASVAAQLLLPSINTARIAFAGAYHGWGFHEDGARSGLAAAHHFGWEWRDEPQPQLAEVIA